MQHTPVEKVSKLSEKSEKSDMKIKHTVPTWLYALGAAGFVSLVSWNIKVILGKIENNSAEIKSFKEAYVTQQQLDRVMLDIRDDSRSIERKLENIQNILITNRISDAN